MNEAKRYLDFLNKEYFKLHKRYEDLFWLSYMGDHSVDKSKQHALALKMAWQADAKHVQKLKTFLKSADNKTKGRLQTWLNFFDLYQTPPKALVVKKRIDRLESEINKKRNNRKEGYIDPYTKKFVEASENQMGGMIGTNPDEKVRRACYEACQKLALTCVGEYVELVKLRNKYAKLLGYEDLYDYKVQKEDGMTKPELFGIFDKIYQKTKYANKNIKKLEKQTPGLRKPWNFGYMMAGDFTKEEDPYFPFDEALTRWGRSFAALGIDFKGSKLTLDLLDRKGKWNNGFCHWPEPVHFDGKKRFPGSTNFTCNVVFGQVGAGQQGLHTLFHEGGHAAHYLNSEQVDICLNHEFPPASMSWAETQSMFLDHLFGSVEWADRYALDKRGKAYPLDLWERELKKLHILRPLALNSIISVANFEKEIYETKNLDKKKVLQITKKIYKKYYERSESSVSMLNTPHIYNWDSTASYHGYGLATLSLTQWREHFLKKYGYIVDNPKVGREMAKLWQLASSRTFNDFVVLATGHKLSAEPFIKNVTASIPELMKRAKARISRLKKVKPHRGKINLNADIRLVHGKKEIANNKKGFESMAKEYKKWLRTQTVVLK